MLIKKIVCSVNEESKERFHSAQLSWSPLKDVPGFVCQFGGWEQVDNHLKAVIMGIWESKEVYDYFMKEVHDKIFFDNGQGGTYTDIKVELFEVEMDNIEIGKMVKNLQTNNWPEESFLPVYELVEEWTIIGERS